jgi:hypothetical protein
MNFFQQAHAGLPVEVMQDVGQKHKVVALAEVNFKRAAGHSRVAVANPGPHGILFRHFQHVRPINRDNLGLRVLRRDRYAVHPVASRYVQNFKPARAF